MSGISENHLTCFATTIERNQLINVSREDALMEELMAGVIMLSEEDEAGIRWCDEQGYLGYTSYASLDDLPQRIPAFAELEARIVKAANVFARALGFAMGEHKLAMDSFWVNILEPGAGHSGHIHPNSIISGTFYLYLPDGSGAIRFEDPRLPFMMNAPPLHEDVPAMQKRFVYIDPEPGQALFWESWLRHEVMVNRAEEPRVSVSFNLS